MTYEIDRLPDYSKDEIIKELHRIAEILKKDALTLDDLKTYGHVSKRTVLRRFGSWNNALKAANLKITREFPIVTDEQLFNNLKNIWDKKGSRPIRDDFKKYNSLYSASRYKRRFGSLRNAYNEFIKWNQLNESKESKVEKTTTITLSENSQKIRKKPIKHAEYGEPIDFLGLRHAPINEQGVVYLFGMISRQLGFIIEAIRTEFPDCEGKREIPGKKGRWERVTIEFEYRSSTFFIHGHNPEFCDIIVCWEDDLESCPIEVISLKKIMKQW